MSYITPESVLIM